jgi:hypothetical protein
MPKPTPKDANASQQGGILVNTPLSPVPSGHESGVSMDQATAAMRIHRELQPGENLLWSGLPRQGVFLRGSDAIQIPFSLAWGGFACFWEYSVINTSAPFFFKLWGIPFIAVGVYMAFGRFYMDSLLRSHTIYAVTNKRIMFISGLFNEKTTSIELSAIPELSVVDNSNGCGRIAFGPSPSPWQTRNYISPFASQPLQAFELSENVRAIYNLVVKAQADYRRASV